MIAHGRRGHAGLDGMVLREVPRGAVASGSVLPARRRPETRSTGGDLLDAKRPRHPRIRAPQVLIGFGQIRDAHRVGVVVDRALARAERYQPEQHDFRERHRIAEVGDGRCLTAETLLPLRQSNPDMQLVIPEANRAFVADRLGCELSWPVGLDAGEQAQVGPWTIHAVPAAHDEVDRDEAGRCHYLGYVVEGAEWTVFQSGDTRLYPR